jgi:glycosyltransferase involved in cell wall biosynthesis
MNILFIFYIPSGGVETLNRQRALALRQKGINCHFIYFRKGAGIQNKEGDASVFITNNKEQIKNMIVSGNYKAIIVCSNYYFLRQIRQWGYQGALIYEVQGMGINKNHTRKVILNGASPNIKAFCDGILYPKTPHLIELFDHHFSDVRKFCFHNCIDTNTFNYKHLQPEKGPVIAWVGRLEKNKNWMDFLKFGSQLVRYFPSLRLWIFEDPTLSTDIERKKFYRWLTSLKLSARTTVHSNVPHKQMADYFSQIGDSGGFLCSTSMIEGFGYAVLEAMSCRCPVLTTDSDGVKSFIVHNTTGKFFNHGNIKQAVNEAKELVSNLSLRENIRNNGLKHVKEHFSPSQYSENFLEMLKTLKAL